MGQKGEYRYGVHFIINIFKKVACLATKAS